MTLKNILYLSAVILIYLSVLFITKKRIFAYRFDPILIQEYFLSQDIPAEVPGKRLFLSDGEIHIAAGFLYANGRDPTKYNFQHPPLVKYLYGFSILLFNNPYYTQIFLGIGLLLLTYVLAVKIFRRPEVGLLACLFLVADPLFLALSSEALLDLGQAALLLFYVILSLYFPKRNIFGGITLGLLAGTKFWAAVPFFLTILIINRVRTKKFTVRTYLLQFTVAFLTFSFLYLKTFWDKRGQFNIIFWQLKTIRYWFNHSVASMFGSSLILFLTGYLKSWWGEKNILRESAWTIFWPVSLSASLLYSWNYLRKKVFSEKFLIAATPFVYLLYLGFQAPFARYFILILPFLYIVLSETILSFSKQIIYKAVRLPGN